MLPPRGSGKLPIISHLRIFLKVHCLHFRLFFFYGNDDISLEEMSVREKKWLKLERTFGCSLRWSQIVNFHSFCIAQFFLLFVELRPPCLQRMFCSSFGQRMLLLYVGMKMKTFTFWSVFRRRRRSRRLRFGGARSTVGRICPFIHPPSLRTADVGQHRCLTLQQRKD